MLPGWYGVGRALSSFDDKGLLREMAAGWPFFKTTLDNMEMVLAKTDLAIARRYAGLVEDRALSESIFGTISEGWALTRDSLLDARSEEHTSELQSLMRISYAVFCLKKKTE